MMANSPSPLTDAYNELRRRYRNADSAGDWQERSVVGQLVEIADYVARIGDNAHSAHYRADKAGPLLQSAIRLQAQTLLGYAGWPEGDAAVAVERPLDLLGEVTTAVVAMSWLAARGAELYRSDADALNSAVHELVRWAEALTATAVPNPVE